jgi:DNA (cytosine-5)-methyltransferase 1
LVVLNAINLPDSVANLYFRPPPPDLQTLLYTTAQIVMGVDGWDRAIESYDANFRKRGESFLMKSTTNPSDLNLDGKRIELLLASPECTNHTCAKGAGERSEDSKKTANYVLRFAADLTPRWIVIENVIHMKNWKGYRPLLNGLHDLGYKTLEVVLDSVNFGVPQTRKRLFILCDLKSTPLPLPSRKLRQKPASAILDYDLETGLDTWLSKPFFSKGRAIATIERFNRGVEALGKGVPFLIVYYGSDGSGGWQPLDRPLRTITTLDRFGLVTWQGSVPYLRMLQVPELMRAMGFKDGDGFRLVGSRREQIKQLGNGVCPPVMEAIIKHLTKEKPAYRPFSAKTRSL